MLTTIALITNLTVAIAFGWLMAEKISQVRATRRRANAEAKVMESAGRSVEELGRRLASGGDFTDIFKNADCDNPACPIHGAKSGGKA